MVLERQNFPPAGNFKGTAGVRGIGVRLEIRPLPILCLDNGLAFAITERGETDKTVRLSKQVTHHLAVPRRGPKRNTRSRPNTSERI
jgi:hypothetical protein